MITADKKGQVVHSAADIYETFFVPALFQSWPEKLAGAAGIMTGQRVLDVACGTGILARHLAECVGDSQLVDAIDINEGMLAVARQKAPGINWHRAAAEQLPFEDNSFDSVFCQFGLMFFDDRAQAIREMQRVLRPQGQLVIAVWDRLENTPGYLAVTHLLDDLFGSGIASEIRAPYVLGDIDELKKPFTAAGIDDISIITVQGTARFPSINDWMYTDIKGWTLADMLDDSQFELLRTEANKALQRFSDNEGTISFAAPAHIIVA